MRFEGAGRQGIDARSEGEGTSRSSKAEIDPSTAQSDAKANSKSPDPSQDPEWTIPQFHFHFLTSLLPHLLRTPERDIRIISLISPGYAAALPSLQSLHPSPGGTSPLMSSGVRGLTELLLMGHFARVLDVLYASTYGKIQVKPVPKVSGDGEAVVEVDGEKKEMKERDKNAKSNIMAVSVVMPWCRGDVLRGIWGADETWLRWFM